MGNATSYIKDPDAYLDYAVDWSDWLASGETISTSAWAIDEGGSGLTLGTASLTAANTKAVVWADAGTLGVTYKVRNRIVTSAGREDDRTLTIKIVAR